MAFFIVGPSNLISFTGNLQPAPGINQNLQDMSFPAANIARFSFADQTYLPDTSNLAARFVGIDEGYENFAEYSFDSLDLEPESPVPLSPSSDSSSYSSSSQQISRVSSPSSVSSPFFGADDAAAEPQPEDEDAAGPRRRAAEEEEEEGQQPYRGKEDEEKCWQNLENIDNNEQKQLLREICNSAREKGFYIISRDEMNFINQTDVGQFSEKIKRDIQSLWEQEKLDVLCGDNLISAEDAARGEPGAVNIEGELEPVKVINETALNFLNNEMNQRRDERPSFSWLAVSEELDIIGFIVVGQTESDDRHVLLSQQNAKMEVEKTRRNLRKWVNSDGNEVKEVRQEEIDKMQNSLEIYYLCGKGGGVGTHLLLYAMTYLANQYQETFVHLDVAPIEMPFTQELKKKYYHNLKITSKSRTYLKNKTTAFAATNIVCYYNTFFGFQLAFPKDFLSKKDKQNREIKEQFIEALMGRKNDQFNLEHMYNDLILKEVGSKEVFRPDPLTLTSDQNGLARRILAREYPTIDELRNIFDNRILTKNQRTFSCGQYLRE